MEKSKTESCFFNGIVLSKIIRNSLTPALSSRGESQLHKAGLHKHQICLSGIKLSAIFQTPVCHAGLDRASYCSKLFQKPMCPMVSCWSSRSFWFVQYFFSSFSNKATYNRQNNNND
jgi:hypothetical protein